jgi:ribosomal protein S18 acetylase RimI-like enzyme
MSESWPEPIDADAVRLGWTAPGVEVALDARLEERSYAIVEDLGNGSVWIDLRGSPSAAMLDWAEGRAAEKSARVLAGGWSSNEALLRELERRGFRLVRHAQRMEIALGAEIPAAAWPEGIELRTFRSGDERAFYETYKESFEDSWEPSQETFEEWAHFLVESPTFDPGLWFLALDHGEPAGFAICHPHPGTPELGWVRILGVRRPWRRRGLGRALLLHAFGELRSRGMARAGLSVDSESLTGANRVYEQGGMYVSARFDIYEKAAR